MGTVFYLAIDIREWRWWTYPLLVLGSNAILVYAVPILVKVMVQENWQVHPGQTLQQWLLAVSTRHYDAVTGGRVYTQACIAIWWLILWQLYRKKILLRV